MEMKTKNMKKVLGLKELTLMATLLLSSLGSSLSYSQEGYPLDGTWRGSLVSGDDSERVLMIMKWDGDKLDGMINPGPMSFDFQSAELDAPNWTLQVEAETREGVPVMFTGVLTEVGSPNRSLEGTWVQAGTEYSFKVIRE
jgi:hypothetical protein